MSELLSSNILKDVIAEMDQLVSVATANAKISLEEEFTPAIKSMLTRRLRVEADERAEQTEGAVANPSDASIGVGGADFIEGAEVEVAEEIVDEDLEVDENADLDLEAIIAELEKDLGDEDEEEGEEEEEEEEEEEGEEEEEEGEEEEEEGEEEEEDGEEEVDAAKDASDGDELDKESPFAKKNPFEKDETEVDSTGGPTPDGPAPEADLHMDGPMDAPPVNGGNELGNKKGFGGQIDLEALMQEIEMEETAADESYHQLAAKYEAQKAELSSYKDAVNVLREKIHEVNLLNGKLLFTSQLFRKDGLSAEQKIRIVEAFDRCVDIREVKLVYAALAENIKISATKKPAKQKKMVTEGIASAAVGNAPEKKDAEVITESTVAKRLQFLAGIPTR